MNTSLLNKRDDFSARTRLAVAARAGWRCSFAGCPKLTVGPSEESPEAVTSIGVAAHIAAASPGQGARRFNAAMSPEERSGIENAIWLCADHATLIDRDEVTYTADMLRAMKRKHEAACARAVRTGVDLDIQTGLLAIGPDIVCSGEIALLTATSWTLRPRHFLTGDIHKLVSFISDFASVPLESRYVLSNDLGDGRELTEAPSLVKEADGYRIHCPIAPSATRLDGHSIGGDLATHDETNDLYLDASGDLARVSGLDYLPQLVRSLLSMQRGESWLSEPPRVCRRPRLLRGWGNDEQDDEQVFA